MQVQAVIPYIICGRILELYGTLLCRNTVGEQYKGGGITIEPVIISLIIAGGGLLITAIFNSRNYNRNINLDSWSERERTKRVEDKLNNLTDEIKRSNKELTADISEIKGMVSDVSDSLKKTQIRHERLKGRVDDVTRRVSALERWKDSHRKK